MKTVKSSAVQTEAEAVGGKRKPGRQWKTGPNPNLCPIRRQNRTLFEVPLLNVSAHVNNRRR